jgi:hypothetical protein
MPKVLVLFQSPHPEVAALADAARDGARRVRFAEVDVRRAATSQDAGASPRHRGLEHADDLGTYDGVIVVLSGDGADDPALVAAIGASAGSLRDKVGSVLSASAGGARAEGTWAALRAMANREMILVPAPSEAGSDLAESARRIGQRVAETVGWVTHARSHHQHDHHHHDQHDHQHHDQHGHQH